MAKGYDEKYDSFRDAVDMDDFLNLVILNSHDLERLSEFLHDLWMGWANSIKGEESLSSERLKRWETIMVPYSELSEEMKDKDRKYARQLFDELGKKTVELHGPSECDHLRVQGVVHGTNLTKGGGDSLSIIHRNCLDCGKRLSRGEMLWAFRLSDQHKMGYEEKPGDVREDGARRLTATLDYSLSSKSSSSSSPFLSSDNEGDNDV